MEKYNKILNELAFIALFYLLLMIEVYLLVMFPVYRILMCLAGAMVMARYRTVILAKLKVAYQLARTQALIGYEKVRDFAINTKNNLKGKADA